MNWRMISKNLIRKKWKIFFFFCNFISILQIENTFAFPWKIFYNVGSKPEQRNLSSPSSLNSIKLIKFFSSNYSEKLRQMWVRLNFLKPSLNNVNYLIVSSALRSFTSNSKNTCRVFRVKFLYFFQMKFRWELKDAHLNRKWSWKRRIYFEIMTNEASVWSLFYQGICHFIIYPNIISFVFDWELK